MKTLQFDPLLKNFPGFRPDAVMGDTLYAVLLGLRDSRKFRATLLDVARVTAQSKEVRRAVIILDEPAITGARLKQEWHGLDSIMRPDVFSRLSVVVRQARKWSGIPTPPTSSDQALLDKILQHVLSRRVVSKSGNAGAYYEILRILVHQWLLGQGPISIGSLMEMSGTSHPTVSRSIERMEHYLKRNSNRSVELKTFPRAEWTRLVAMADDVRSTVRFVDRCSGRPRSPDSLIKRLRLIKRDDIAVGGVLGARHYCPGLDLIGNPRLDLSIHSRNSAEVLSFVRQLDPALEQVTRRDGSATLVIHRIRRAASLFQPTDNDLPWADPVECLLDLHEMWLEGQALQLLRSFPHSRNESF